VSAIDTGLCEKGLERKKQLAGGDLIVQLLSRVKPLNAKWFFQGLSVRIAVGSAGPESRKAM
jgi:hypothetical protein